MPVRAMLQDSGHLLPFDFNSLPCRYFGDIPVGFTGAANPLVTFPAAGLPMANRVFDEATLLQAAAILQQQQFEQQQHNFAAQAAMLAMQQSGASESLARSTTQV